MDNHIRTTSQRNSTCTCSHHEKGYTLILPDDRPDLTGTIVSLEDNRLYSSDTTKYQRFKSEALKKGFAFLIIATGVPVDLYFSEKSLIFVDTLMKSIFTRYRLPDKNIFLLGILTSGHRALKYIEYCKSGKSLFYPAISGVILIECVIDWVRQWYECQKQVRDHLDEERFFEGTMITYLFNENLNATPITDIGKYIRFSSYSYFDMQMEKPKLFRDLAIRAYTYADIRYWFSARGKGVYDSNYPDMSGFINEQKLAGNQQAELIVFHGNDRAEDAPGQQTATWDMVDKRDLVDWIVRQTI
jgi:hypothetical protein